MIYKSLLDIPFRTAEQFPDRISHKDNRYESFQPVKYSDFARYIRILTAGFSYFGIKRNDHVSFFVNNRYEWISTDFALIGLGAVSVPRGSDSTPSELNFIFRHSDSVYIILENNTQLNSLLDYFSSEDWDKCRKIFIMDNDESGTLPSFILEKCVYFKELAEAGEREHEKEPFLIERLSEKINENDIMTIVYTSGTTGNPKGVMLSHRNFLQNVYGNTPRLEIDVEKGEKNSYNASLLACL